MPMLRCYEEISKMNHPFRNHTRNSAITGRKPHDLSLDLRNNYETTFRANQ